MNFFEDNVIKKVLYVLLGVLGIAIVISIIMLISYNNKLNNSEQYGITTENIVFDDYEKKEASSSEDKNIADVKNENKFNSMVINRNVINNTVNRVTNVQNTTKNNQTNSAAKSNYNVTPKNEVKQELKFEAPVSGDIIKDFSNETLIYSKTLDEWTTHPGIDIKGEKTSIVKASEAGTIESIKNDPRYGITITISHSKEYKTVYSNLLTTEFVKEGQKVEKGQTIATIGETASFEILDEPHLHFEMYKDGVSINPTMYLK